MKTAALILAALALALAVATQCTGEEPTADYIVTIENHELTVLDVNEVFEFKGGVHLRRMPENLNDMRRYTLGFMLEVAEHYHFHAMFTIITDEYPSPFEYKAYVKMFTPEPPERKL
jgi:hypothetical protein